MPQKQAELKYPIQFRIGKGLLKRIDKAAWAKGVSRNTWIAEAIQRRLNNPASLRACRVTATELMSGRAALMARLDELTLDLVNEATEDNGATRTIWVIDSMLSALAREGC